MFDSRLRLYSDNRTICNSNFIFYISAIRLNNFSHDVYDIENEFYTKSLYNVLSEYRISVTLDNGM